MVRLRIGRECFPELLKQIVVLHFLDEQGPIFLVDERGRDLLKKVDQPTQLGIVLLLL